MPFCGSRAEQNSKVLTSSEIISNWPKTAEPDNWIQTRGIQQEGAFKNRVKSRLSSAKTLSHKSESAGEAGRSESSAVLRSATNSGGCPWGPETERREALFTRRKRCIHRPFGQDGAWMNSLKRAQSLPAAISPPAARLRSMAGIHPKQHLAQDLGSRGAFKTSLCAHISPGCEHCFRMCYWSGAGEV